MSVPVQDRAIYASADRWKSLRADAGFLEIVRLSRVLNSLSLNYSPILIPLDDQSPKARRDRFGAFVYIAALLQEGLLVAQSLGKHFRDLPQYRSGFAAILGDPSVVALRSGDLAKIRNELVFHFDRDSLAVGLSHFPEGKTVIATASHELKAGEFYFDLADDALLAYLYGDAPNEEEYIARVARLMEQVSSLFQRFIEAGHRLIPAALAQMGCEAEPFQRPAPPEAAV